MVRDVESTTKVHISEISLLIIESVSASVTAYLPTETAKDRHEYSKFRRSLLKSGFMMMQESVYIKLALNQNNALSVVESVRKIKPAKGLVQVLTITEKQFQRMEFITGEHHSEIVDSDERLLIL